MRKKVFLLMLTILILAFSVIGCGSNSSGIGYQGDEYSDSIEEDEYSDSIEEDEYSDSIEEDEYSDSIEEEALNPLIGSWEDEKDVLSFNSDGTISGHYYYRGGSYMVDESNSTLTIIADGLGKKEYYYDIDGDTLTMRMLNDKGEIINVGLDLTRVDETEIEISNPLIGSWEDEKDVLSFNSDGTISGHYYYRGGSYMVDESNSTLTIIADGLEKKEYYYDIDGDTLTMRMLNDKGEIINVGLDLTRVDETEIEISNPLIGSWEDEKDVLSFNSDGTISGHYYYRGGSYMVDESNSTLTIIADGLEKKEYYYDIDGDTLTMRMLNDKGEIINVGLDLTRVE